ncbi:unnamed protein product [Albugo candida]|uniref:Uncharacterized protein n=1 Tax=Albugo candida TaxID=65357 RepID=A0A024GIW8_9STRA|nr:unnamed protein product [Albugo candida]|eukprot:CCI46289.1 unnamed protein product [Albugo candida]
MKVYSSLVFPLVLSQPNKDCFIPESGIHCSKPGDSIPVEKPTFFTLAKSDKAVKLKCLLSNGEQFNGGKYNLAPYGDGHFCVTFQYRFNKGTLTLQRNGARREDAHKASESKTWVLTDMSVKWKKPKDSTLTGILGQKITFQMDYIGLGVPNQSVMEDLKEKEEHRRTVYALDVDETEIEIPYTEDMLQDGKGKWILGWDVMKSMDITFGKANEKEHYIQQSVAGLPVQR